MLQFTAHEKKAGFCSSVSSAQDGCHDPRIAATVEYSQDNEGFFIWCVRDQKIPYRMKPQWPRSKVGTTVTLLRKEDEGTNRLMDFLKNAVSSAQIVRCDEFPDFLEVCESVWVENKPAHEWRRSSLLRCSRLKASSPSMGSTLPLLISS